MQTTTLGYLVTAWILLLHFVPVTTVDCPNGDTAGVVKNGQTCSQLIASNKAECYDASIESTCCQSCNDAATSYQSCLYGDRVSCFSFLCSSYNDLSQCCLTCISYITTASLTTVSSTTVSTSTTTTSTTTSTTSATTSSTSTSSSAPTSTVSSITSTTPTSHGSTHLSPATYQSDEGDNGAVIAGATVGSVVSASILTTVAAFVYFKHKKRQNQVQDIFEDDTLPRKPAGLTYPPQITLYDSELPPKQTGGPQPTTESNRERNTTNSKDSNEGTNSDLNEHRETNNKTFSNNAIVANGKYLDTGRAGSADVRKASLPPLPVIIPGTAPIFERLPPITETLNNDRYPREEKAADTSPNCLNVKKGQMDLVYQNLTLNEGEASNIRNAGKSRYT